MSKKEIETFCSESRTDWRKWLEKKIISQNSLFGLFISMHQLLLVGVKGKVKMLSEKPLLIKRTVANSTYAPLLNLTSNNKSF
ncbi:hypothetical protein AAG747_19105 [Rapidithrix thailandica]|uniref:Uncharacterized protein n=1 Tax=Rapidithrix thailandica TaxID=413964 RepID=A0AAW9SE15_9BACT